MHTVYHCAKKVAIIEFAKYPEPGNVKTRLATVKGFEEASRIYREMAQKTHSELMMLQEHGVAKVIIYASGAECQAVSSWLDGAYAVWLQPEGDLGERLDFAFRKSFEMGFQFVLAVGTDCPDLTAKKIQCAIKRLDRYHGVIVPVKDGGYALIGLNTFVPELFRGISWSSNLVLAQTLQQAKRKNVSVSLLESETDIDTIDDLNSVEETLYPELSVIIPVLNDRIQLEQTLNVFSYAHRFAQYEIIVVDGGSHDGSAEVARNFNFTVLGCSSSRARQMNLGAHHARGRWLWFLHADCRPDVDTVNNLSAYLRFQNIIWGFFQQRILERSKVFRMIEKGNELRAKLLGLPYGDQGIIVRRDIFMKIGGFKDVPFLEDVLLSRRLSQICRPVKIHKILTMTPRHWMQHGSLLTTIRNLCILLRLFLLRQSPKELLKYLKRWEK